MARFHFITHWQVDASCEEVYQIIKDSDRLVDWWPDVYLKVKTIHAGDEDGLGKRISLLTKGYFPYKLKWNFIVSEIIKNKKIALIADGDLNGIGLWTFEQMGKECKIVYDWKIEFDKPYLSKLVWLLRPFFEWNHRWAMRRGYESLLKELKRRKRIS